MLRVKSIKCSLGIQWCGYILHICNSHFTYSLMQTFRWNQSIPLRTDYLEGQIQFHYSIFIFSYMRDDFFGKNPKKWRRARNWVIPTLTRLIIWLMACGRYDNKIGFIFRNHIQKTFRLCIHNILTAFQLMDPLLTIPTCIKKMYPANE